MSPDLGILLSVGSFLIGQWIYKKSNNFFLFNPLLIATIIGIAFLLLTDTPYEHYAVGGDLITSLLQPATVAFAIPLYKQRKLIAEYWKEILIILVVGQVLSVLALGFLAVAMGLSDTIIASLITQPATTAIAAPVSESLGGIPGLTASAVILNAVIVSAVGQIFLKKLKVDDEVTTGLALGTAGHAIGASLALEIGEVEGALATVAMVLSSILTVFVAPALAPLFGIG